MDFHNLTAAIQALPQADVVRIANEARPPADYLFATLLPERTRYDYTAKTTGMTVRATMAGLVGMDSPYPEVGAVEVNAFSEGTAKLASRLRLPEANIRELQQLLLNLRATAAPTNQAVIATALNFVDKLIVQPHLDAMEYLRGQAIVTGNIDWTFNQKRLLVDYGLDSGRLGTERQGTARWSSSASDFWKDVAAGRRYLRKYGGSPVIIMHPDTLDDVRYNAANNMRTVAEAPDGMSTTFQRFGTVQDTQLMPGPDNTVTIISYGAEGEIMDLANPGKTVTIPFMPKNKMLFVARGARSRRFEVGEGSTASSDIELGYTHLAPTIEGGGTPGRWAEVYTPQDAPWTIEGRGVTNGLPVIEATDRIYIARTAAPD